MFASFLSANTTSITWPCCWTKRNVCTCPCPCPCECVRMYVCADWIDGYGEIHMALRHIVKRSDAATRYNVLIAGTQHTRTHAHMYACTPRLFMILYAACPNEEKDRMRELMKYEWANHTNFIIKRHTYTDPIPIVSNAIVWPIHNRRLGREKKTDAVNSE